MDALRDIVAAIMALFGFVSYCSTQSENSTTGEKQYLSMTPEQEIALGRQLGPRMAEQLGGVSASPLRDRVRQIGGRVVSRSSAAKTPYQYVFHLLGDRKTVNAFALPGGQIFITEGLLALLTTEDEIAAVLGHEVGHVLGRHSAEQLAKQQLTQTLLNAVVVGSGDYNAAQVGQLVGSLISMNYGRGDELEADTLGLRLVSEGGYDPRAMIAVMQALEKASGGSNRPEFASTHPSPANRIQRIREQLDKMQK